MSNMLIDYPQTVVTAGQDKGLAELSEGAERTEVVERGGRLLGFNLGGGRGWAWSINPGSVDRGSIYRAVAEGMRAAVRDGGRAGLKECRGSLPPGLLVSPSAGIESA